MLTWFTAHTQRTTHSWWDPQLPTSLVSAVPHISLVVVSSSCSCGPCSSTLGIPYDACRPETVLYIMNRGGKLPATRTPLSSTKTRMSSTFPLVPKSIFPPHWIPDQPSWPSLAVEYLALQLARLQVHMEAASLTSTWNPKAHTSTAAPTSAPTIYPTPWLSGTRPPAPTTHKVSWLRHPSPIIPPFPSDHTYTTAAANRITILSFTSHTDRPDAMDSAQQSSNAAAGGGSSWGAFLKVSSPGRMYTAHQMVGRWLFRSWQSIASFNGDLASLTAPPFILSGTSLTEFSSYWCEHPPVFAAPARESDPAKRALLVLKWFLTTLKQQYASRSEQYGNEKKPLNPFLGELFLGKWEDEAGVTELISEQVRCVHHQPHPLSVSPSTNHSTRVAITRPRQPTTSPTFRPASD